jgi:uncharacterized Zn-binding protein involved in type VI secretion
MGQFAATQGDQVKAVDVHVLIVPGQPVPAPVPHLFAGVIDGGLSADVRIGGKAAATVGSTATNTPPHTPEDPTAQFQRPPTNRAQVQSGSTTVQINGRFAARAGDPALTCNDPVDQARGRVVVLEGTVRIG